MTFVLLASLSFGLVGFGVGLLLGLAAGRVGRPTRWALSAALVLAVFLVPALFILDRAAYVLDGVAPGPPPAGTPALPFAALSVLVLIVALGWSLTAAVR